MSDIDNSAYRRALKHSQEPIPEGLSEQTRRQYAKFNAEVLLRLGAQVFVLPVIVARELDISPAQLQSWIRHGTPSGEMLRSIKTICSRRRVYIDVTEYQRIAEHFDEFRKRKPRTKAIQPQPG